MAEKKDIPEWNLFDRLDEIEDLWLKESDNLETLKKRYNDLISLGIINFIIGAAAHLMQSESKETAELMIKRIERDIKDKELKDQLLKIANGYAKHLK